MLVNLDNLELGTKLKAAHEKLTGSKRNIRLPDPKVLKVNLSGNTATICVSETSIKSNMQEDRAAFEGWALALRFWLSDIPDLRVKLFWPDQYDYNDPHVQRFLYRAIKFDDLFYWVDLDRRDEAKNASFVLSGENNGNLFINGPGDRAEFELKQKDCEKFKSQKYWELSEDGIEKVILKYRPHDLRLFCMDIRDRQLPVGLFKGQVDKGSKVFTGGKSAVDLFAIKGDELHIYELKTHKNAKIGILSELFFYTCFFIDFCNGVFKYENNKVPSLWHNFALANIEAPENFSPNKIVSHLFAPKYHPLLDNCEDGTNLLDLLNSAMEQANISAKFVITPLTPSLYCKPTGDSVDE